MYQVTFNKQRVSSGTFEECKLWIRNEGRKIYGSGRFTIKLQLL